jgi:hypothetical protein
MVVISVRSRDVISLTIKTKMKNKKIAGNEIFFAAFGACIGGAVAGIPGFIIGMVLGTLIGSQS